MCSVCYGGIIPPSYYYIGTKHEDNKNKTFIYNERYLIYKTEIDNALTALQEISKSASEQEK